MSEGRRGRGGESWFIEVRFIETNAARARMLALEMVQTQISRATAEAVETNVGRVRGIPERGKERERKSVSFRVVRLIIIVTSDRGYEFHLITRDDVYTSA